ncbi:MAG: hypothetical protein AB1626_04345 [Candidatus Micrarchaeota archaeon]
MGLRESIKALVVRCGDCGEKQLWDECTTWRQCTACGSMVVLKTIAQSDLEQARAAMFKAFKELGKPTPTQINVAYSDYTTYVLGIEDIERLKQLSRDIARAKKVQEEKRSAKKREEYARRAARAARPFRRLPRRFQRKRRR